MQRYKCHKIVEAAKGREVAVQIEGSELTERILVTAEWPDRFKPESPFDLGYLVKYDDGYMSWSPTKAFEDGYDRMQGS